MYVYFLFIALAILFSFNGVLKERPFDIIGYIIALVIIELYTIAIFGDKKVEQRVAIKIVSERVLFHTYLIAGKLWLDF